MNIDFHAHVYPEDYLKKLEASKGDVMKRRVLIIDDETNIRRMMRLTLETDGYEVEDAPDACRAARVPGPLLRPAS